MHRKHGIDQDTEVTEGSVGSGEGIPVGSGVPLPKKLGIFFPVTAHFGAFVFIQEFIWKSYNVVPTQLYCP